MLASRFKEKYLLQRDTKITFYRKRVLKLRFVLYDGKEIVPLFRCNRPAWFIWSAVQCNWMAYFHWSQPKSINAVLLYIGNLSLYIPVAYIFEMKADFISHAVSETPVHHITRRLKSCCYFEGIANKIHKSFWSLCLWDSRANDDHYKKKLAFKKWVESWV